MLADRPILEQRPRHETAEADQAGVERPRAIGHHVPSHRRMHAIGADHEIAFGRRAVGEMRDDRLVGAILDMDEPFLVMEPDIRRTRPC